MNGIIKNNKTWIDKFCIENKIEKLYVFGSVLGESFDDDSDIDFIIKCSEDIPILRFSDYYFSVLFGFEDLFKREIDLITERFLNSPYFIKELNDIKKIVWCSLKKLDIDLIFKNLLMIILVMIKTLIITRSINN